MKVKVREITMDDIKLARVIINKIRHIVPSELDYIVESMPDVSFFMSKNNMSLNSITFQALEVNDCIRVDEEMVVLEMDDGVYQILLEHEGFYDLLGAEKGNMDELNPEIKKAVVENREYYRSLM